MLDKKHIIVGITGSIAAYKAALLVRDLVKAGAEVRVVMTPAACEFIAPLTLATLSMSEVVIEMFPENSAQGTWHIHLGIWGDAMIIAPASANTIAKLAHGFADNALTALALAVRCPVIVSPAMDTDMYQHIATQENLKILSGRGIRIIEPESGELASGLSGPGRLPDTHILIQALEDLFAEQKTDLCGVPVLITAGPTHEKIDPVRFIGNHSSGKMGFALAEIAAKRGANVTLVSGPVHLPTPPGVNRIDTTSANEMFDVVTARAPESRIIIMAAAVADFRPVETAQHKIKKDDFQDNMYALRLTKNPDILTYLGERKHSQVLIGFALETDNPVENAKAKMRKKNTDMIIVNDPTVEGAGFSVDTNVVTFVFPDGRTEETGLKTKAELADIILDRAVGLYSARST